MHDVLLVLHSWVRWIAIAFGVLATVRALRSRPDAPGPARTGLIFTIALDTQLLLGLLLLLTSAALDNLGETMRDATSRFYAVEHPTLMIVAIALAVGSLGLYRWVRPPAADPRDPAAATTSRNRLCSSSVSSPAARASPSTRRHPRTRCASPRT